MEQIPADVMDADVEEDTRKRKRIEARRKFRILTTTVVAMGRFRVVLELDAEKKEQAESEILASLGNLGLQPLSEESVDANIARDQGQCSTHSRAEGAMATGYGSPFIPHERYSMTEVEKDPSYKQSDGEMITMQYGTYYETFSSRNLAYSPVERQDSGQYQLNEGEKETGPVEESPVRELQNMFPAQIADVVPDVFASNEVSDSGSFEAFLEDLLRSGPIGEQAVDSPHSPRISTFYEGMQSGTIDQFSEQHDVSDSESPMQTMENNPEWTNSIIHAVNTKISEIYFCFDQASDRTKLQTTQSEAEECSVKLQKKIRHFQGEFNGMFNELKTTLAKISKRVPEPLQQQLNTAISQVDQFSTKELEHLLREADGITKKLVKVVDDLRYRNVSTSKTFQNCASSVTQLVESVLAMTSKFVSVADFNRYTSELYSLPNFRAGAGKVVRS